MPPEDALEAEEKRLLFVRPLERLAQVEVGWTKPPNPMGGLKIFQKGSEPFRRPDQNPVHGSEYTKAGSAIF